MILNLALFFGWHVFWPQGFTGSFDATAAIVCLLALVALFRYKIGTIPVIAASGGLGLLLVLVKPWLIQLGAGL